MPQRTLANRILKLVLILCSAWASEVRAADDERDYFALVVGVGNYPPTKFKKLPGAEPDAIELSQTLIDRGFRKENVTVLTNSRGATEDPRFTPTAENIRREVDLLLDRRKKSDVVVIAMAGHGLQLKGQPYVFCPFDADAEQKKNLISIDELYEHLRKSKAEFKLLLVDACRKETLADAARDDLADNLASETRPSIPDPPGGVAAFFSCTKGQVARERRDDDPNGKSVSHGLFFHAVIRGLKGEAEDKNGDLTLPDLEKFVKRDVETYSRVTYSAKQFPELLNQTRGLPSLLPKSAGSRPLTWPFSAAQAKAAQEALAKSLGKKVIEKNSLGMEFVLIPPGKFTMGSPPDEKDRSDNENQVEVTLTSPMWLGKTEVTQGQWLTVMGTTPWKGEDQVKEGFSYAASYISWDDAQDFLKKLGQRDAAKYRLPTEAEWEWSCRAGTSGRWSFDESDSKLSHYAWWAATLEPEHLHAQVVGEKSANPFRLNDMHGNVFEWCDDFFSVKLPGGKNPRVTKGKSDRVVRGGCWASVEQTRSAFRGWSDAASRTNAIGFRVVRTQ